MAGQIDIGRPAPRGPDGGAAALAELRAKALDEEGFVRLVWRRGRPGSAATAQGEAPWERVLVRPVVLSGRRRLQFAWHDGHRAVVKNLEPDEAAAELDRLLQAPFASLQVHSTTATLVAQRTRRGRVILHRTAAAPHAAGPAGCPTEPPAGPALPAGQPDAFLQRLGVLDRRGQVRAAMHDKLAQVNEFLKLLGHTGALAALPRPVHLVDCGCGAAVLTFAAHHYLRQRLGIPVRVTGVDADPERIARCRSRAAELGLGEDEARFVAAPIAAFDPEGPVHVVLALHACDTATDEAIARAVAWGAHLVLAVPCCHRDLQAQLRPVSPFEPLLHHGILRRRLGDLLTDTFRALALQAAGYRTDVVEFISAEHTDRNVMIRAVGGAAHPAQAARAVRQYRALRALWGVRPAIERLLEGPPGEALRG